MIFKMDGLRYESNEANKSSNFLRGKAEDFVAVTSSIETSLIPFTSFPFFVKVSEPFVDFEIVKSDIG